MSSQDPVEPHLTETIPDDLLKRWRSGPLLLARTFPVVELQGDLITLRWGRAVHSATIEECHFRIGRAWQMKYRARRASRLFPFGDSDLILIDFPPLKRGFFGKTRSHITAPVGYTPESLEQWSEALGVGTADPAAS